MCADVLAHMYPVLVSLTPRTELISALRTAPTHPYVSPVPPLRSTLFKLEQLIRKTATRSTTAPGILQYAKPVTGMCWKHCTEKAPAIPPRTRLSARPYPCTTNAHLPLDDDDNPGLCAPNFIEVAAAGAPLSHGQPSRIPLLRWVW